MTVLDRLRRHRQLLLSAGGLYVVRMRRLRPGAILGRLPHPNRCLSSCQPMLASALWRLGSLTQRQRCLLAVQPPRRTG